MSKPYMVSQTIKYSDGTETVIRYKRDASVELLDLDSPPELAEAPVAEAEPEKELETPSDE